jgi:hypothetical protein
MTTFEFLRDALAVLGALSVAGTLMIAAHVIHTEWRYRRFHRSVSGSAPR